MTYLLNKFIIQLMTEKKRVTILISSSELEMVRANTTMILWKTLWSCLLEIIVGWTGNQPLKKIRLNKRSFYDN